MKTLYILLTRSPSVVSKMIHFTTSEPYTHSSLAFSGDLSPLYSFARKHTNLPLPAGFKREVLQEGFLRKHDKMPCAVYAMEVSDEAFGKTKASVLTMMESKDIYRYNLLGLVFCRLQIPYERENRYFCSEFISTVLQNSGAAELPKPPSLFHPVDFTTLPNTTLLYDGNVCELRELLTAQPFCADNASETAPELRVAAAEN